MPTSHRPGPAAPPLRIAPLTPDRWLDLARLFGPRGACAGCWCMWWRIPKADFRAGQAEGGEGNRAALEALVRGGTVPGLLAYDGDAPVAWVAVEPRPAYPRVFRSRNLAPGPTDDAADDRAWAITCFFVARTHRRRGLMRPLIAAAVAHARRGGARTIEAYPVDYATPVGAAFVYTGAASAFRAEGFDEVARRSPTRPVVRLTLTARRAPRARARARARSTPRSSPTRASPSRRGP
jgi:GNAT superfamily N-acetyltransferase